MKIVQVVNAMIGNSDKISNVIPGEGEIFFLYDGRFKWSIRSNAGEFAVHFYPLNDITIEQLSTIDDWEHYPHYTTFKTDEIKTKEANESFSELYQIVNSKLYGIDDLFDEILKS